jgi:hypothetical protein
VEQKALVAEDSDTQRLTRKQELAADYGVSRAFRYHVIATLRTYLRVFRGVHRAYLHLYVASYEALVNVKTGHRGRDSADVLWRSFMAGEPDMS